MQAIQTKYFGPSNVKGSRIKAACAARSVVVGYDYALNSAGNHIAAAEKLIALLGWTGVAYGTLATGTLADGSYVHVLTGHDGRGDA